MTNGMDCMYTIHIERLKSEILELAEIGKGPLDKGIYRMAFTNGDIESRKWLIRRMRAVGLVDYIDGAGNVFALPSLKKDKPSWIVGSHRYSACGRHAVRSSGCAGQTGMFASLKPAAKLYKSGGNLDQN